MKIRKITPFIVLTLAMLISCAHTSTMESYKSAINAMSSPTAFKEQSKQLFLGDNGFIIKGNLQNRAYNLIVVFEYTPENIFFLDSSRTDSLGNFTLSGLVPEEKICYLQFGPNSGFPIALNNKSVMALKINETASGISYELEGENVVTAKQMKSLLELNSGYLFKLNALQQQAMGYSQNSNQEQMNLMQMQMLSLDATRKQAIISEFNAYEKPSLAPYFAVQYLMQEADIKGVKSAYEKCAAYAPNSEYTKILKLNYEQNRGTAIGSPAPEIKQKTPQGKDLALSSLKGKVVLIDFWASWCRPCMMAMPELKATYAKYKDKGFDVFGVSFDKDSSRWANTIVSQGLVWKQVSDLQFWSNAAAKPYQINSIPATYLIDKKGNIAAKNLTGVELELKIEELLNAPN